MHYDLRGSFLEAARGLPKEICKKVLKSIWMLSRTPNASGLNLEKLHGKADGLWSIRVDDKYRIILHKDEGSMTLLFVGPEQDAYLFAERAPKTEYAPLHPSENLHATPAQVINRPPAKRERMEIEARSRTAKYVPLARFLLNLGPAKKSVTLSFSEVEQLLGAGLPPAARRHRAWWGNEASGHVQASAWLSMGWRVAKVTLPKELVTFERENAT